MFGFDTIALAIITVAVLREAVIRVFPAQDAPAGN
jgi:hypothetical protein